MLRLSRTEFEQLISAPLDRFITAIGEVLQRNGIGQLAAVATVGGGAAIPLITTPAVGTPASAGLHHATTLVRCRYRCGDARALQSSAAAAATGLAPPSTYRPASPSRRPRDRASPTAAVPTEQFPGEPGRPLIVRWPGPKTAAPARNRSPTPALPTTPARSSRRRPPRQRP